jgi:hypothetical protein
MTLEPPINVDYAEAMKLGKEHLLPIESKYDPWLINYDVNRVCKYDSDCTMHLKEAGIEGAIAKCGNLTQFNLTKESDNLNNDPLIMYDIVGFENYPKAMLTIF